MINVNEVEDVAEVDDVAAGAQPEVDVGGRLKRKATLIVMILFMLVSIVGILTGFFDGQNAGGIDARAENTGLRCDAASFLRSTSSATFG